MGYSGARGTRIYEKNLKAKILCQTLFNKILKHEIASVCIKSILSTIKFPPQYTIYLCEQYT